MATMLVLFSTLVQVGAAVSKCRHTEVHSEVHPWKILTKECLILCLHLLALHADISGGLHGGSGRFSIVDSSHIKDASIKEGLRLVEALSLACVCCLMKAVKSVHRA